MRVAEPAARLVSWHSFPEPMAQHEIPETPDFRALFEATPTPYLVLTPQLHIAAVNDA